MNDTSLYNRILNAKYAWDGIVINAINENLPTRNYINDMLRIAMNRYNQGDFYNAKLFIEIAERTLDE